MERFNKARSGMCLGMLGWALSAVPPAPATADWGAQEEAELVQQANATIERFKASDPGLVDFFDRAAGWAVFPTVGKGGFWLGGAFGRGVLYEGGVVAGFSELRQITIGLQFGGQAYSEVVFLKDGAAVARYKSEKVEFDAQVSAVAADRGAAANVDYHDGVAVFTLVKGGLMAEASVGGQQFSFHPGSAR